MFSREDHVRTPVQGLRNKLRNALRKAGFEGKFTTCHLRRDGGRSQPCLVVGAKSGQTTLPFESFEGMSVSLVSVLLD